MDRISLLFDIVHFKYKFLLFCSINIIHFYELIILPTSYSRGILEASTCFLYEIKYKVIRVKIVNVY